MLHLATLLALALQDPTFPLLEKDPWAGFAVGSQIVRETTLVNRVTTEEIITLKAIDGKSRTVTVLSKGEEDEQVLEFAPFTGTLVDAGYKATGKSNRLQPFGTAKVKTLLREFGMEDEVGNNVWRVATADEVPGGLYDAGWGSTDDTTRSAITYGFKALEKLKVQGRELSCARFEARSTTIAKGSKRIVEGSYWLSELMPGLVVKSTTKTTEGKDTSETRVQITKFEAKK